VDAFEVHRRLIHDYQAFTDGFVDIHDRRVRARVEEESERGAQWPAPWLSVNPSFEPGGRVDELVREGLLHEECSRIFRVKRDQDDHGTTPITLHRHQSDAVRAASTGASYVLTTGTGSGKSLAYIVPIVNRVLREGSGRGVRAIVVYPMNALANSQQEELRKFLEFGYGGAPPVTFARYTGQEKHEERQLILANPPDILLTNYVMLELVLTRPDERRSLIRAAEGLRFLVLDELHTYRGRQGADVAMLVRRVRDACRARETLQCIGTSATMASGGTIAQQQADVADAATRIFGVTVRPEHVITETLVRATTDRDSDVNALTAAVRARGYAESDDPALHAGYQALRHDPLGSWIEDNFGVRLEPGSKRLIRCAPTTVEKAADQLADFTGQPATACANAIRATLLAGSRARSTDTGQPLFAFRLHQFLSKGGTVYTTLEPEDTRPIETEFQVVLPGEPERRLFPLVFCRECGQEYLSARRGDGDDSASVLFKARHGLRITDSDDGYLFVSADREWPADPVADGRLPASWLISDAGGQQIVTARRKDVPVRYWAWPDGQAKPYPSSEPPLEDATAAAWIPGTFRFCLRCGVSYESRSRSEFGKLVTLDREGRSSAVTVVASSVVRALRGVPENELPASARKLLTFVDNRQDASLQAGHFNDFALVVQLRSAIHRAAEEAQNAGQDGLDLLDLGVAVPKHLGLEPRDYAQAPEAWNLRAPNRALSKVIEYRVLRDLQRGWRVTLPNLEQCGLIQVDYPDLAPLSERDDLWQGSHPLLAHAEPGQRQEAATVLLNEMRRVLAIDAEALTPEFGDRLRRESREHLAGLWAVPENEPDPLVGIAIPGRGGQNQPRNVLPLSGLGMYGRWLRQPGRFGRPLSTVEADDVIHALMAVLHQHGLLAKAAERGQTGYRVKSSAMLLRPGDGKAGAPDPVRRRFEAEQRPRVVPFFRDLYLDVGNELAGLRAAEHTAQVRPEVREEREQLFREGPPLPLLFCSPTLELGVDISTLNAVAMRNVPPTPANYAQRSGRAGRSGQPALVVTYCASGNSHDSYYFQRSQLMVSGEVQPPRLDLANEDLVKSHVHAVWLAETEADLGRSMADVLALGTAGYPVQAEIAGKLRDPQAAQRAEAAATELLAPLRETLRQAPWWDEQWVAQAISGAFYSFGQACVRWRELYAAADGERQEAARLAADATAQRRDREEADQRYREARQRIELLLNASDEAGQSDFYTYRYLASEGFLPGYSFPRLPLAAYVPGSRGRGNAWLQRPRFLAISEFGPRALIYHEGARYQVKRISLPRGGGNGQGEVIRTEARVCEACGYHHPRQPGLEVCEGCGERLDATWRDLLQIQTVITRRRERISADEEERNRVGFELRTTYRFVPRGNQPGMLDATATAGDDAPLATVSYGDAAEVRITNLGRSYRKNKEIHGFWLDLIKGEWLTDKDGQADDDGEDDDLESGLKDVQRKALVVPYVQDRRNILVLRWARELTVEEPITLQFALERGIEATYQLEDSELNSELLPDKQKQGRVLFVEAAEGGAGVLRRLQSEESAFAQVAAEALRIIHVDPETGEEQEGACVRGCYRCLLSYGNQPVHEAIDRRLAVAPLLALTAATTRPAQPAQPADNVGAGFSAAGEGTASADASATPRAGEPEADLPDVAVPGEEAPGALAALLALVDQQGLRPPDRVGAEISGVRVDLVYETGSVKSVVLVDYSHGDPRDTTPLIFGGWNVIHIGPGEDLASTVAENPGVFGQATR